MNWNKTLIGATLIGASVTLTLAAGGCSSLDDISGKDDERGTDYRTRLPDDARVVEEGRGDVDWRATSDGTIYLYDASDKHVLYSLNVRDGQRVSFDAKDDSVELDGRQVKDLSMADENSYQIAFVPEGRHDDRVSSSSRVPDSAKVVDKSRGGELSYRATHDGTAYLWNNTDNKLVETFRLEDGQSLNISTRSGDVALDRRIIKEEMNLNTKDEYRLLFDRE